MDSDAEYKRLCWHSRRGMLELDLVLEPFVKGKYLELSKENQLRYQRLLECEDQDLFAWFMGRSRPQDEELFSIVETILSTKQLRIRLQPSILAMALLVGIHLLGLLALALSNMPTALLALLIVSLVLSFHYNLYRYGLLLLPNSLEVLEFKQQCWRLKLRGESVDKPASIVGRLAFGVVMLEVRDAQGIGSGFLLLTENQLCPEQFRILKGLVISA